MLTIEKYILPVYWASALINNDFSGLNKEDENKIHSFLERNNIQLHHVRECSEESYFSKYNDANEMACDVLEYTVMFDMEEEIIS